MGQDTPAVGGGGYTNPVSGWTFQYSNGMPLGPTKDAATGKYFFDFPTSDGVHYVVNNASTFAPTQAKTVKMDFTLSGQGTWGIADPGEGLPPTVHLYLQRKGDDLSGQGAMEFYRWWSARTDISEMKDYSISAPLNAGWTDVFGKRCEDNAQAFADAIANGAYLGFTFGGCYFAGHGLFVPTGSIRFTLNSFTVA